MYHQSQLALITIFALVYPTIQDSQLPLVSTLIIKLKLLTIFSGRGMYACGLKGALRFAPVIAILHRFLLFHTWLATCLISPFSTQKQETSTNGNIHGNIKLFN